MEASAHSSKKQKTNAETLTILCPCWQSQDISGDKVATLRQLRNGEAPVQMIDLPPPRPESGLTTSSHCFGRNLPNAGP